MGKFNNLELLILTNDQQPVERSARGAGRAVSGDHTSHPTTPRPPARSLHHTTNTIIMAIGIHIGLSLH